MVCLKKSLPDSLLFTLLNSLVLLLCTYTLSFYLGTELGFGPLAAALILWLVVIWIIVVQYFYAVFWRLEQKFLKILRKMVILFLDNLLFSLGLFLCLLILAAVSIPTLLMIPGMMSLPCLVNIGLKFRLRKYDYLEQQQTTGAGSPAAGQKIPWLELLLEEQQALASRSLKGTFFPWRK